MCSKCSSILSSSHPHLALPHQSRQNLFKGRESVVGDDRFANQVRGPQMPCYGVHSARPASHCQDDIGLLQGLLKIFIANHKEKEGNNARWRRTNNSIMLLPPGLACHLLGSYYWSGLQCSSLPSSGGRRMAWQRLAIGRDMTGR